MKLLDKLLSLAQPIPGADCAYRSTVRQLKKCITDHRHHLTRDCPVSCISDEVRNWASDASNVCSMCGMNHTIVEVYNIGNQLYGHTAKERKHNVSRWMKEGSAEYHKKIRRLLEKSSLSKMLEEATARHKITDSRREYTRSCHDIVCHQPDN